MLHFIVATIFNRFKPFYSLYFLQLFHSGKQVHHLLHLWIPYPIVLQAAHRFIYISTPGPQGMSVWFEGHCHNTLTLFPQAEGTVMKPGPS